MSEDNNVAINDALQVISTTMAIDAQLLKSGISASVAIEIRELIGPLQIYAELQTSDGNVLSTAEVIANVGIGFIVEKMTTAGFSLHSRTKPYAQSIGMAVGEFTAWGLTMLDPDLVENSYEALKEVVGGREVIKEKITTADGDELLKLTDIDAGTTTLYKNYEFSDGSPTYDSIHVLKTPTQNDPEFSAHIIKNGEDIKIDLLNSKITIQQDGGDPIVFDTTHDEIPPDIQAILDNVGSGDYIQGIEETPDGIVKTETDFSKIYSSGDFSYYSTIDGFAKFSIGSFNAQIDNVGNQRYIFVDPDTGEDFYLEVHSDGTKLFSYSGDVNNVQTVTLFDEMNADARADDLRVINGIFCS